VWSCQVGESRKARYAYMSREAKGLWSWGSTGLAASGTVDSYSGETLRSLWWKLPRKCNEATPLAFQEGDEPGVYRAMAVLRE